MATLTSHHTYQLAISHPSFSRERFFWTCAGGVAVFSLLYLYFIGGTVLNIVERKNTEAEIRMVSGRVAGLESEYIEQTRSLDIAAARVSGYAEIKNIAHISRISALTLRE
ncbi:hypothetical protein L0Y69_02705 [bacterium]|nr:hypothetical protein [bacterium]